jgi:aryl-alcohol dehydrogenase-like predicted oxidoreductase
MLERRKIPHTDLEVSLLCLGTMTFGTPVGETKGIEIVHRALDLGLNFIDTANMYEGYSRYIGSSGGTAEEILGKGLRGRREEAIVATKVGMKIGPDAEDEGLSRKHVLRECDRSLQRLGTDWIDLYYMHKPDPEAPLEESIGTFVELIRVGKVRHWGLSNFDAVEVEQVLEACAREGWPRPVVHQPPFSLLKRDIESDLLPLCRREEIGVVPFQVLQGGLLSGKYQIGVAPPEGSRGAEKPEWLPLLEDESVMGELQRLAAQAEERGMDLFEYTLRTTVAVAGITSIILGIKRSEQIEMAVRVFGGEG